MSSSSSSPAPQSSTNSSAPSKGGAGGGSGGGSPSSQPSSPPPSSPPPQAPPPKSSPPPSSPPPSPPPSSPPPKASPPPPPKSSPSPPPSSSPPSSPPPPSKSPPSSPPPPSSSSPPSGGDKPPPPPNDSPPSPGGGESPAQSPPSGDQSPPSGDQSPPPPGDQSAPPPPLSPPAAPGTPSPPNPNPGAPPVPSPPAAPASNSTTKAPLAPPPPKASSNSTADQGSSSSGTTGTVIGLTVAGVFLLALIAVVFVFVRRRKKRHQVYPPNYMGPPSGGALKSEGYYQGPNSGQAESFYSNGPYPHSSFDNSYGSQRGSGPDSGHFSGSKVNFSYEEMMEITNGFTRQNVLGEGGFGCVYKGWMPDGRVVAVKQLKAGSGQGEKEFRAEVDIISRVHHRHLVSLVGYCISDMQRMLIYEFVPNKTLEHHLHGPGMPVLEWTKRLKIALGSAKGLAYLHEDCHPKIIHRDIKSANILLDDVFEAQVADFGLAKLTSDTNTHVSTRVMGTFGYMAPEYASSGKLTDRSDVFSFGVVLLELVTGRKPVDPTQPLGDESLVEWARPLLIEALESGDLSELVDPRLEKHYVEAEMVRMIEAAAACVRHSATKRPRMAQVCRALDCEGELSDLSNGVKFGQSTAYDSGQYNEDIAQFRRMALGTSGGSSELDISSAEFTASREISGPQSIWTTPRQEVSSDESETRAFTNKGSASRSLRNNSVRRF